LRNYCAENGVVFKYDKRADTYTSSDDVTFLYNADSIDSTELVKQISAHSHIYVCPNLLQEEQAFDFISIFSVLERKTLMIYTGDSHDELLEDVVRFAKTNGVLKMLELALSRNTVHILYPVEGQAVITYEQLLKI
jgi:hypothetical protein